jgi:hypothetical protein
MINFNAVNFKTLTNNKGKEEIQYIANLKVEGYQNILITENNLNKRNKTVLAYLPDGEQEFFLINCVENDEFDMYLITPDKKKRAFCVRTSDLDSEEAAFFYNPNEKYYGIYKNSKPHINLKETIEEYLSKYRYY